MQIKFDQGHVLVVGDIMLDRYWSGDAARISPEAPVPVLSVQVSNDKPGGAGNVALNIAALSSNLHLLGVLGCDENGKALKKLFDNYRISAEFQYSQQHPTTTKLRVLSVNQQLLRLDFEENFSQEPKDVLFSLYAQQLGQADVVVFSDYAKGALSEVPRFIQAAKKQGKLVIVDPKGSDYACYTDADIIIPSLKEFTNVVGACNSEAMLAQKAQKALKSLRLDALLITRGADGMTLFRVGQPPFHVDGGNEEVFDVTGASDTVTAILSLALANGCELAQAVRLANTAAGIIINKVGTATVSLEELAGSCNQVKAADKQLHSWDQARERVAAVQRSGQKVVMTNGVFDILHVGHVGYLREAKKYGDKLIVALNTDESTRRLNKGPERPIYPLAQRMKVLAGLDSVDWVVPFAQDTPKELVAVLRPDVLVKGEDYQPHEIAGSDIVFSYGGQVLSIQYPKRETSTSRIVDHLRAKETGDAAGKRQ